MRLKPLVKIFGGFFPVSEYNHVTCSFGRMIFRVSRVSDLTKKEKTQYEEYASNSLVKQKIINSRMTERDLKKIQAKAIEEGLPYQSLISMLIHKYSEGKVSI